MGIHPIGKVDLLAVHVCIYIYIYIIYIYNIAISMQNFNLNVKWLSDQLRSINYEL